MPESTSVFHRIPGTVVQEYDKETGKPIKQWFEPTDKLRKWEDEDGEQVHMGTYYGCTTTMVQPRQR